MTGTCQLARKMMSDSVIAEEVMRRIPIGRLGLASEVAAAVIWFCRVDCQATRSTMLRALTEKG
jgi:hypothetical protein